MTIVNRGASTQLRKKILMRRWDDIMMGIATLPNKFINIKYVY